MISFGEYPKLPTLFVHATEEGLSSLWRIELLHPAAAHFPIVLILLGTGFWVLGGAAVKWPRLDAFALTGQVTLVGAAVMAWVATQSGFWADGVVGRELYDPRPLKDHENLAILFSWIASGSAAGALLCRYGPFPRFGRRLLWWLTTLASVSGCIVIVYVAHLGAGLVYQQGAGVILPE